MNIKQGRHTANYPEEFVVVLIGFRINKLSKVKE